MQPGPGYYVPIPTRDPNKITPTDILIPLGLSVFCGFGGFVWGLVRMSQDHHRPGWVAIGINAGLMALGFVIWLVLFVLLAGVMNRVPTPAPAGSAVGSPGISSTAPSRIPEKPAPSAGRKRP